MKNCIGVHNGSIQEIRREIATELRELAALIENGPVNPETVVVINRWMTKEKPDVYVFGDCPDYHTAIGMTSHAVNILIKQLEEDEET